MDFQNFGIQWKVWIEIEFDLRDFHLIFEDILKIGGPYARLAFLNASIVSKAKKK